MYIQHVCIVDAKIGTDEVIWIVVIVVMASVVATAMIMYVLRRRTEEKEREKEGEGERPSENAQGYIRLTEVVKGMKSNNNNNDDDIDNKDKKRSVRTQRGTSIDEIDTLGRYSIDKADYDAHLDSVDLQSHSNNNNDSKQSVSVSVPRVQAHGIGDTHVNPNDNHHHQNIDEDSDKDMEEMYANEGVEEERRTTIDARTTVNESERTRAGAGGAVQVVLEWDTERVVEWLKGTLKASNIVKQRVQLVVQCFRDNDITGATLLDLDRAALQISLNVQQWGVQTSILKGIQKLKAHAP